MDQYGITEAFQKHGKDSKDSAKYRLPLNRERHYLVSRQLKDCLSIQSLAFKWLQRDDNRAVQPIGKEVINLCSQLEEAQKQFFDSAQKALSLDLYSKGAWETTQQYGGSFPEQSIRLRRKESEIKI